MYQTLEIQQQNHIATINFNRPQHMNCFNDVMGEELAEATKSICSDKNIKVIILRGNGKLFMAGGDIVYFKEKIINANEGARIILDQVDQIIKNLTESHAIVISSAHGSVAGIGLSFLCASDLALAAHSTKFTTAYAKIAATMDGSMSYFLPRIVGHKKAMELALLSDIFDATTAEKLGIINYCVADSELAEQTQKLAERIAAGPSQAFIRIKSLLMKSWQNDLAAQLDMEAAYLTASVQTPDFAAGVNAFLNKSHQRRGREEEDNT